MQDKSILRIFAITITIVISTLAILNAVFPFPEGQRGPLPTGTSEKVLASPGWLSGFDYRKEITLSNAAASLPVRLKIGETSGATGEDFDVEGHCNSFPYDIRFTKSDEQTELYPSVESLTGTSPNRLAIINVGLTDSNAIYCYYGNEDAFPASDTPNTFSILGEDFNDYKNYFDNWVVHYAASTDFMGPYSTYASSVDRTYQVLYGPDGDIYITYFDHDKNIWADRVFVHTNPDGNTGYGSPTICRAASGHLNVFYGQDAPGSQWSVYQSRSDSADDISSWTYKGAIYTGGGSNGVENANPVLASNGDIYLFFVECNTVTVENPMKFIKSSDGGASWGSATTIIEAVAQGSNDAEWVWAGGNFERVGNRIPISWIYEIEYDPDIGYDGVYYAYFDTSDSHLYSVDDTDLGTSITRSEADTYCNAVDINDKSVRFSRVRLDASYNPYIIYLYDNGATIKYYLVSHNGSSWQSAQEITTCSGYVANSCDFEVISSSSIKAYLGAADDDIEQWDWNGSSWNKNQTIANAADYDSNLCFPLIPLNYDDEFRLTFSQDGSGNYKKAFAWGDSGFLGDYVGYATDTELQAVWAGGSVERTVVAEGSRAYYYNGGTGSYKEFTSGNTFTVITRARFSESGDKLNFSIQDSTDKRTAYVNSGYPTSGYWGYRDSSGWHDSGVSNSIDTWYYIKLYVNKTSEIYSAWVSTNGDDWTSLCSGVSWSDSGSSANRIYPRSYVSYYDYIRIYPYAATEPAFSSAGGEEEQCSGTATSATYPSTMTTESVTPEDDNDWDNPTNIGADDSSYASVTSPTFDTGDITYRLKAQNFGFSIPSGATINGIKVEIERYNDDTETAKDYRVQLLDGEGSLVGDNKADTVNNWPTTDTIKSYGGYTDTWSASPTYSMVNDSDFGVVLSAEATATNADIYVDYIRMTICYTSGCSPSIGLDQSSWSINGGSPVSEDTTYNTGLDWCTITNNSGGAVTVYIQGADMIGGGYTWDLSDDASNGDMIYGMHAGLYGDTYNIVVKESTTNTLKSGLADEGTQDFGLQIYTPTNFDDGNSKSGATTLTAVCD